MKLEVSYDHGVYRATISDNDDVIATLKGTTFEFHCDGIQYSKRKNDCMIDFVTPSSIVNITNTKLANKFDELIDCCYWDKGWELECDDELYIFVTHMQQLMRYKLMCVLNIESLELLDYRVFKRIVIDIMNAPNTKSARK